MGRDFQRGKLHVEVISVTSHLSQTSFPMLLPVVLSMTRGPNKQFDTEVTLSKAIEVFCVRGFMAASISDLLKNMGIAKKSLYDTFGNKESLFLKALDHYDRTIISSISSRLSAPGSPLANIKAVLQDMQSRYSAPGSYGSMLGTNIADFTTDDEVIARELRQYLQNLEDIFFTALTRAQQAGELSATANPRDLARLLLCTTQGMALLGRVLENETILKSTVEATMTLLKEV